MNKKTSEHPADVLSSDAENKQKFLEALQHLASEQRRLEETLVLPSWMGSLNRAIAHHAFPLMLIVSGLISMGILLANFPFFFDLGRRLL